MPGFSFQSFGHRYSGSRVDVLWCFPQKQSVGRLSSPFAATTSFEEKKILKKMSDFLHTELNTGQREATASRQQVLVTQWMASLRPYASLFRSGPWTYVVRPQRS